MMARHPFPPCVSSMDWIVANRACEAPIWRWEMEWEFKTRPAGRPTSQPVCQPINTMRDTNIYIYIVCVRERDGDDG